jgi:hypothetical protein
LGANGTKNFFHNFLFRSLVCKYTRSISFNIAANYNIN